MQTSQASFLLSCETLSTNQCKRLDRFLFLLNGPSYQSITQKPLDKMPYSFFPPFWGGETRVRRSEYLKFPECKVVPRAQDPCQHLALWVCTLLSNEHCAHLRAVARTLSRLFLCTETPRGSLEVHLDSSKAFSWSGSVCELSGPVYHSKLEGAPEFVFPLFIRWLVFSYPYVSFRKLSVTTSVSLNIYIFSCAMLSL